MFVFCKSITISDIFFLLPKYRKFKLIAGKVWSKATSYSTKAGGRFRRLSSRFCIHPKFEIRQGR
ncbi:hypothetical protein Tsubulata_051275, partial [Turnera subulata]